MPECISVAGAQRHQIARNVARERQSCCGSENSGSGRSVTEWVTPFDLSRLVIDRSQKSAPGDSIIGAGPSVGPVFGFEEVNPISILCTDNEKACLRIETW